MAVVKYVSILHLSAQTTEDSVGSALSLLLATGKYFHYAEAKDLFEVKAPETPALAMLGKPALNIYDGRLTGSLAGSAVCRWRTPTPA